MELLYPVLLAIQILVGVAIIGLVLIQHGKGADMGAAFGGGTSGSIFGASGSANFLSRTTAVLAAIFFLSSLGLSYVSSTLPASSGSVLDKHKGVAPVTATPAVPPAAEPAPKDAVPK